MKPFKYSRATSVSTAARQVSANSQAKFLAGGTNIIDLMKEFVERPDELVDVTRLNLSNISTLAAGGISIGATAKNAATANHPLIRQHYPLLSQAILAGASAQIRNMATNGGNLNQRTRCAYFYDIAMPCNKRQPDSGCSALEGVNRMHAIVGWSNQCVAVHPSDMCVALAALDAVVKVQGPDGTARTIPITDYHRLPEDTPHLDNNLRSGELITSIEIPANNFAAHSYYLKVRDRSSYAFALVSVAAAMELNGGTIKQARIAMGGIAHKPWRLTAAESFLAGKTATADNFKLASEQALQEAKPLAHNAFKIELGRRSIVRALQMALGNII
ncbi:FAD binding domain-containing protein [Longitalea luteola]|uniref:FAD binding domain-containing protein n=1 Tax=Longitalea luteola TaxID=2812563 RepID=UPI001A963463|nr:xanthine dehydrogenase family protein subunit M [Longitalea luteola]